MGKRIILHSRPFLRPLVETKEKEPRRKGALVRRRSVAIFFGCILLSACAESPLHESVEYATKACAVPPISGILRGDRSTLVIEGWTIEVKKEFFEKPAQEYKDYSAQWEIHHKDLERACRFYQICKAQNRSLWSCSQEGKEYDQAVTKARAFMVALNIAAKPADERTHLKSELDTAMNVALGLSEPSTFQVALQEQTSTSKPIGPEEKELANQLKAIDPQVRAQAAYRIGRLAEKQQDKSKASHYYQLAADYDPKNPAYLERYLFTSFQIDENGSWVVDQKLLDRSVNLLETSEVKDPFDESNLRLLIAFYYQKKGQEIEVEKQMGQINSILGPILTKDVDLSKPLPPITKAYRPEEIGSYERLAEIYNKAAVIRSRQEKFDPARKDFTRAVELQTASGEINLDMARYLSNLADTLYMLQRYNEAEKYQREALLISQQELGPVHKEVADNLRLLGLIAKENCPWYKQALNLVCGYDDYHAQALSIYKLTLTSDDFELGEVYFWYAKYYEREGSDSDLKNAFFYYARALEILEKAYKPYSPKLLPLLESYVKLLRYWTNAIDRLANPWLEAGGWTPEYAKELEARIQTIRRMEEIKK